MLARNPSKPTPFQLVDVRLVSASHRPRKIDVVLDLRFFPAAVVACDSTNRGRHSISPELALRMMLLRVLYDLGDREVCDEILTSANFASVIRVNVGMLPLT